MPPHTPKRMRGTHALPVAVRDLPGRDLFERDGQVVLGDRVDHRGRELLEGPLAEVVVVGVDLARALGGDDHARVRRVDMFEKAVYARRDHGGKSRAPRTIPSRASTASSRRSLITTCGNSSWAASSDL